MREAAWFAVGFGVATLFFTVLVVAVDISWHFDGIATVSQRALASANHHPILAAIVGAIFGLALGVLLGHVYFPQGPYGPER